MDLAGLAKHEKLDIGCMPAFKCALVDAQITELAAYMHSKYAPNEAAWPNLPADIARLSKVASN